jgi:hypothetical protein
MQRISEHICGAINPTKITEKSTTNQPSTNNARYNRRQGRRLLIRYQSREYDPMWSFILSECNEFNSSLEKYKMQLNNLLKSKSDLRSFIKKNIDCQNTSDVYMRFLRFVEKLELGLVLDLPVLPVADLVRDFAPLPPRTLC